MADWRATLGDVVRAFVVGDFEVEKGLPNVEPIAAEVAEQMRAYVLDYGETLVDVPEKTLESSVAQWMDGYWEVLVDLWTVESGASDLVLSAQVREQSEGFRIEIQGLYVP